MSRKMSSKQIFSPFPLLLIFFCCSTAFAQSPAQAPVAQPRPQAPVAQPPARPPVASSAPPQVPIDKPLVPSPPKATAGPSLAPAPAGPPNVTAILEKAGHFNTLIRLLKSTQLDAQLYKQLNDSSQSLTMFAPSDKAFSSLKTGSLNSYSDQQKFQLIKFHLMSTYYSLPAFQTVSNPVSTDAGSSVDYPINITTSGSQVDISTGIVNATISSTIYTDNQLAVYQIDEVLLPLSFFVTPSPSPAPALSKPGKKKAPSPEGSTDSSDTTAESQSSDAMSVNHHSFNAMLSVGFLVVAVSLYI